MKPMPEGIPAESNSNESNELRNEPPCTRTEELTSQKSRVNPFCFDVLMLFCLLTFSWSSMGDVTIIADYSGDKLLSLDLTTGARVEITSSTVGSGDTLVKPLGVARESDGKILVVDDGSKLIRRVNPTTGARTVVSSSSVGTGQAFARLWGLAVASNGQIYVADLNGSRILRVDPTTGNRTVISDSSTGTGDALSSTFAVLIESDGNLVSSGSGRLLRIDPATGNRTVISSSSIGTGNTLSAVTAIAQTTNGYYVLQQAGTNFILFVNSTTGDRTVITGSSVGTGGSSNSNNRYGLVLTTGGSLYFGDFTENAIYQIDTSTGNRTTVSSVVRLTY